MSYKRSIKGILGAFFRLSLLTLIFREWVLRNKAVVICYHNLNPIVFRSHLKYLVKNYNVVSLSTLANAIANRDWSLMPPKSLIITFDDGYKTTYSLFDVIREFNIPVTVFLCSHIVNTHRKFWYLAGYPNYQDLKVLANSERLRLLKKKVDFEQDKEYEDAQSLSLDEIMRMSPNVDFQAHSRYHPILTNCDDVECWDEINESKKHLEGFLGHSIRYFSYPNGDYGEREVACLQKAGYQAAVTMDFGCNDVNSDLFRLKRIGIEKDFSVSELAGEVSGIFSYLRLLFSGRP